MKATRKLGAGLMILGYLVWARWFFLYWVQHPELTEMQVWLLNWPKAIGGALLVLVGTWVRYSLPVPSLRRTDTPGYKLRRRGRPC